MQHFILSSSKRDETLLPLRSVIIVFVSRRHCPERKDAAVVDRCQRHAAILLEDAGMIVVFN